MSRKARFPVQAVVEAYRRLENMRAVSRELGLSPKTVAYHLRKAGVETKRPPPGKRLKPKPVRKYDLSRPPLVRSPCVLRAVELARTGLSNSEIAERMGLSRRTVSTYLSMAFNPRTVERMKRNFKVYSARCERRRLLEALENLSPATRAAVSKVFGDVLRDESK